jgi:4-amino-4-deoxy-L-arabinose transferase-like glycosyltransferase
MNLKSSHYRILLLLLGMLLYLPFLGQAPLFDWDEVNFAESAREMLVTGNFSRVQINFQPFWEKPPLFIWMQAMSMSILGVNEYAARLPNAIFGIINLLMLFEIGRSIRSDRFGFLMAICMGGSFLPHVYFKSGIIDPVFNTFIFAGIWYISKAVQNYAERKSSKYSILAGVFIGLAILTKGPVALLIAMLTVGIYWAVKRFKPIVSLKNLALTALSIFTISLLWFGPETIKNGPWFLEEFITYQIRLFSTPDAGHKQPIYYHFVVVFLGCFPMSLLAIKTLFRRPQMRAEDGDFLLWMKILFWVVMILFSIVTTKIVHYSSMAYLPLSVIAAIGIEEYLRGRHKYAKWQAALMFIPGMVIGLAMLALPIVGQHTDKLIPLIKDQFAQGNLEAFVQWNWVDYLPGILWLIGLILGLVYLSSGTYRSTITILFAGTILSTSIFLIRFPKKIATYTQQAAVDFYKSLEGQDVYVETYQFKSYAQYFYFRKAAFSPQEALNCKDATGNYHIDAVREWYLTGKIDKPVYFVVKNIHIDKLIDKPGLQLIEEKNGFAFFKREVETPIESSLMK